MFSGKIGLSNAAMAAGATGSASTVILRALDFLNIYSVAIGLIISALIGIGGLSMRWHFQHKEFREKQRHNMAKERIMSGSTEPAE